MLTAERVRDLLAYDPESGVVTWKVTCGRSKVGSIAGCPGKDKKGKLYWRVRVDGKLYYAHRLIWAIAHGTFPLRCIDHVNGNGCDNRLVNLRDVSVAENNRNRKRQASDPSKITGVTWNRHRNKWHVRIYVSGREKYLGCFGDFEDAVAARKAAEEKYGFHPNHGTKRPI